MALLGADIEKEVVPRPLPARYRLRDLILGDYAFNDDGERWVKLNNCCVIDLLPSYCLWKAMVNSSLKLRKKL